MLPAAAAGNVVQEKAEGPFARLEQHRTQGCAGGKGTGRQISKRAFELQIRVPLRARTTNPSGLHPAHSSQNDCLDSAAALLEARNSRRQALQLRPGSGRQATTRHFELHLPPLRQPAQPPQQEGTPAGLPPAPGSAVGSRQAHSRPGSTGLRAAALPSPMEGVPERLFTQTPSRLRRAGSVGGWTPMEGVPERAGPAWPLTTAKKPGSASRFHATPMEGVPERAGMFQHQAAAAATPQPRPRRVVRPQTLGGPALYTGRWALTPDAEQEGGEAPAGSPAVQGPCQKASSGFLRRAAQPAAGDLASRIGHHSFLSSPYAPAQALSFPSAVDQLVQEDSQQKWLPAPGELSPEPSGHRRLSPAALASRSGAPAAPAASSDDDDNYDMGGGNYGEDFPESPEQGGNAASGGGNGSWWGRGEPMVPYTSSTAPANTPASSNYDPPQRSAHLGSHAAMPEDRAGPSHTGQDNNSAGCHGREAVGSFAGGGSDGKGLPAEDTWNQVDRLPSPGVEQPRKHSRRSSVAHLRLKEMYTKRKSLAGQGLQRDHGLRRTTRQHHRPLEFWRNERKVYTRTCQSLPTVDHIETRTPGGKYYPGHSGQ